MSVHRNPPTRVTGAAQPKANRQPIKNDPGIIKLLENFEDPEAKIKLLNRLYTAGRTVLNLAVPRMPDDLDLVAKKAADWSDPLPPKAEKIVRYVSNQIRARLAIEGLTHTRGPRYLGWEAENDRIYKEGTKLDAGGGVTGSAFRQRFEDVGGDKFSSNNTAKRLGDGPQSFAERYRLIDEAKESIWIATWEVYGDATGAKTVDALLDKKRTNPNIDIRVMVDGNVAAESPASTAQLARLVKAGIPVAYYHNDERPWEGMHYKSLIKDGGLPTGEAHNGGRNTGDDYSHAHGTPKVWNWRRTRWRDTDVLLQGPTVLDHARKFAHLWNTQVGKTNSIDPFKQTLPRVSPPKGVVQGTGSSRVLLTVDEPGPLSRNRIATQMVAAIHAAQKTVDVENAYVMDVPAVRQALVEAMKRGVRVRVLTNSLETIDETVVSGPIQLGLRRLLDDAEAAGKGSLCEVYVRKAQDRSIHNRDTLHSKVMVVDGQLTQVASINLHGRSLRQEVEGSDWIDDQNFARETTRAFDEGISARNADRLHTANDVKIPDDPLSLVIMALEQDPVVL